MDQQIFEEEKKRILDSIHAPNTKKQENNSFKLFTDFLVKKEVPSVADAIHSDKLDDLLEEFFCTIRKNDGGKMKVGSLQALRYALNRRFKTEFNRDITNKSTFPKSSKMMLGVVVDLKKEGLGATKHFDKIADKDLETIFTKLDQTVPQQLQWLLFILIQLFFCRRGRENIENFSKSTFKVSRDSDGQHFLYQEEDELNKNHRENDKEKSIGGRAYENIENPNICPVKIYLRYLSKLHPACNRLWQYTKASINENDTIWFTNRPIGINSIGAWMKSISRFCNLTAIYTNHCLRVTCISILGEEYCENDIKEISGHKSISSLGIYKKMGDDKRQQISNHLSNRFLPKSNANGQSSTSGYPKSNGQPSTSGNPKSNGQPSTCGNPKSNCQSTTSGNPKSDNQVSTANFSYHQEGLTTLLGSGNTIHTLNVYIQK